MEVKLQKENIGFYRKLIDTCINHEETMEMIVPDTLPDVMDIIDADGTAVLRSKEADNGKISLSGVVRAHIVFIPEGVKGVRSLPAQVPFALSMDAADVKPSSKITVRAELAGVEARVINSRKLIIRADIMLSVSAYNDAVLPLSVGVADGTEIEVLKTGSEINPIVDVTEKTFSFSDELSLASAKPPIGAIIKSSVRLFTDDVKTVGAKLIIKGTAYISILYTSYGSNDLNAADFNLPFSQIMELSGESDNMSFSMNLMPTGIHIQEAGDVSGAHGFTAEFSAVAQLVVWKKMNINYMSDAYNTTYETENEYGEYVLNSLVSDQVVRENMRETIETPAQVRSIVSARVYPGRVRRGEDGMKASVSAVVICMSEEGRIMRVADRFETPVNINADDSDVETNASIQLSEVFVTPSAGGVELRIPVELRIREHMNTAVSPVTGVVLNEEKEKPVAGKPSLVLCRVRPEDSLWGLAKKYNSTRDLIRQANMIEENADIMPNDLLIIAKKR